MRTTPPPPIDITQVFPELAGKARTTVRLHPRRGSEPGIRESKMGGLFLWPADEPWPVCTEIESSFVFDENNPNNHYNKIFDLNNPDHNDAFVGVLQIYARDVPEMPFPTEKNLFQLLWCPREHAGDYLPFPKIYWRKEEEIKNPVTRTSLPSHPFDNYVPRPCILNPERVVEYPAPSELDNDLGLKLWEWQEGIYGRQLSVAPGTKIGGYIDWKQDYYMPACKYGHEMEHLLTIASEEFEYDPSPRWLALEDQKYLSSDKEGLDTIAHPSGLILGELDSLVFFICRECKDWPVKWVLQGG